MFEDFGGFDSLFGDYGDSGGATNLTAPGGFGSASGSMLNAGGGFGTGSMFDGLSGLSGGGLQAGWGTPVSYTSSLNPFAASLISGGLKTGANMMLGPLGMLLGPAIDKGVKGYSSSGSVDLMGGSDLYGGSTGGGWGDGGGYGGTGSFGGGGNGDPWSVMSSFGGGGGGDGSVSFGGLFDGITGGGLATGLSALLGYQRSEEMRKLAKQGIAASDPWGASGGRAGADAQLQALLRNPSAMAKDPAYRLRLQAAQRGTAQTGTDSGATAVAAANAGTDWYNSRLQQLGALAGTGATPGAGYGTALSGLNASSGLLGNSLASLGYMTAPQNQNNQMLMMALRQAMGG